VTRPAAWATEPPPFQLPEEEPASVDGEAELIALANILHSPIIRLWRQLRSEAEHLQTPALHVTLLFQIRAQPGIGVSELAARERMRPSSMNVHLRELSEAGLIMRDDAPHPDRRRVGLAIAPAGSEFLERVLHLRYRYLIQKLADMSASDRASLKAAIPALVRLSAGYVP